MTPSTLPLSGHPLVHTRSLDEAREIQSGLYAPADLEKTERRTPFEWHANGTVVGPVTISTTWYRCGALSRAPPCDDVIVVAIPISAAGGEFVHGSARVPLEMGRTGLVSSPLWPSEVRMEPGFQSIMTVIRRADLEAALSALVGPRKWAPLQFDPALRVDDGPGAAVLRLLRFLITELEQDQGLLTSPLVVARCADALLYALLTGHPHNHTALLRPTPRAAAPLYVRRAEEYMHAHADAPIRLTDLAAFSGVSIRALQAGFRAHRGCSPTQFLRERRLELARTRLLHAPAGTTVAEVAMECGFEHLGRFSRRYRERFGESPTETLRRRG